MSLRKLTDLLWTLLIIYIDLLKFKTVTEILAVLKDNVFVCIYNINTVFLYLYIMYIAHTFGGNFVTL